MITKDTSIFEAIQTHPEVREVFKKHGMGCLSCMGAEAESIEAGAQMHGIDLDQLLQELNSLITE